MAPGSTDPAFAGAVHIQDPILARYSPSALLRPELDPAISNYINTTTTEPFGDPSAPLGFRLGNGGAGYTGILKILSEAFIAHKCHATATPPFHIEWVANHSRHTEVALLAGIVQVALTYEPDWEDQGIREGWAKRVTRVFNDRFILVGPTSDPAGVLDVSKSENCGNLAIYFALRAIAQHGRQAKLITTHHRGDGSATSYKELQLWGLSGIDLSTSASWRERVPLAPYPTLVHASKVGVYILTDRATYLCAKRDGVVPETRAFVDEGKHLLNPCSALVNLKAPRNELAWEFAEWLGGEQAQKLIREFGTGWRTGLPVFAAKDREKVDAVRFGLVKARL
ncbi:hypothetical protein LTR78_009160 [Recurvomyces mirabilis]|uniref:Uncharacterized protein n=1 Tax=Recurvomyces mirabilis TaxID=574656 RepID=A0AAE0WHG9_9PEZI|nr:hypothetical protein LTR78_009160 [Recurvomyces mirabilis]KAK5155680.1 hypothetical protein LTS14_005941 [Recurvomyces mirabilis]